MNNSYWKKKTYALAMRHDLTIDYMPPYQGSSADGMCAPTGDERFWNAINGYHVALDGVHGWFNNLDWKLAYKGLAEDIEEGFYTLDEIKDKDPEEYERLCWECGLRHHSEGV